MKGSKNIWIASAGIGVALVVILFAYYAKDSRTPVENTPIVNTESGTSQGQILTGADLPNIPNSGPVEDPSPAPTSTPIVEEPVEEPTPKPQPVGSAQVISKISTTQKVVLLTFDAGSDVGYASDILDTLKAEGIHASFGMTGRWAEQNPALVRRIAQEGHDLINHTYSHPSFTGFSTNSSPLTQAQRWSQLDRTEEIIKNLTGKTTLPYFRPPYGDYNASVNKDLYARGYKYNIMWTVDSLGWKGLTAQAIHDRVMKGTVPGAIFLFHVGIESQDAAALPSIIEDLRARGYGFVKASDVLK